MLAGLLQLIRLSALLDGHPARVVRDVEERIEVARTVVQVGDFDRAIAPLPDIYIAGKLVLFHGHWRHMLRSVC